MWRGYIYLGRRDVGMVRSLCSRSRRNVSGAVSTDLSYSAWLRDLRAIRVGVVTVERRGN